MPWACSAGPRSKARCTGSSSRCSRRSAGILGGRLADRIGTKRALQLSLTGVIIGALASLGFAPDRIFFVVPYQPGAAAADLPVFRTAPELFYIATVMLIAICLVATYANSRAMMARIAPQERMTEFFGLFALSGEATAFMAPACHRRRDERDRQPAMGHGHDIRVPGAWADRPLVRPRGTRGGGLIVSAKTARGRLLGQLGQPFPLLGDEKIGVRGHRRWSGRLRGGRNRPSRDSGQGARTGSCQSDSSWTLSTYASPPIPTRAENASGTRKVPQEREKSATYG